MKETTTLRSRSTVDRQSASLRFAAGGYEFAHWLSNVGVGPQSLYAGAFAIKSADGSPWLGYCLNLTGSFDTEREYDGIPVRREVFPSSNRFGQANSEARTEIQNRVAWIAQHSFPSVSLQALDSAAGIAGTTRNEAIAATQAAIWTLTNEFLFGGIVDAEFPATERVLAVIDYLLGPANVGVSESATEVSITPGAVIQLDSADGDASKAPRHFVILAGKDNRAN